MKQTKQGTRHDKSPPFSTITVAFLIILLNAQNAHSAVIGDFLSHFVSAREALGSEETGFDFDDDSVSLGADTDQPPIKYQGLAAVGSTRITLDATTSFDAGGGGIDQFQLVGSANVNDPGITQRPFRGGAAQFSYGLSFQVTEEPVVFEIDSLLEPGFSGPTISLPTTIGRLFIGGANQQTIDLAPNDRQAIPIPVGFHSLSLFANRNATSDPSVEDFPGTLDFSISGGFDVERILWHPEALEPNWSNFRNWLPFGPPEEDDTAVFDAEAQTIIIDTDPTVKGVFVTGNNTDLMWANDNSAKTLSTGFITLDPDSDGISFSISGLVVDVTDGVNLHSGRTTLQSGTQLMSHESSIGNDAGSEATLKIMGSGSSFNATRQTIGGAGTGYLEVTDGGEMSINRFLVGFEESANGNVLVDGQDSSLIFGTLVAGVSRNFNGRAMIEVIGGAEISGEEAYLGANGGVTHVTVTDVGSRFNPRALFFGRPEEISRMSVAVPFTPGTAIIEVLAGGALHVSERISMQGPSDSGRHVITVADSGSTLQIDRTQFLSRTAFSVTGGAHAALKALHASSRSTVLAEGLGTLIDVNEILEVANVGSGTLLIQAGARVNSSDGIVAEFPGESVIGDVEVTGTGSLWDMTGGTLSVSNFPGRGFNPPGDGGIGTVRASLGGAILAQTLILGGTGTLIAQTGTVLLGAASGNDSGVFIGSGGTLQGRGMVDGDIVNSGGMVDPGLSPGTLSVTGDYTQGPDGVLRMEIGGLDAGTEYDVLNVAGDIFLGGQVILDFVDGFAPLEGDVFNWTQGGGAIDLSQAEFRVNGLLPGFEFTIASFEGGNQLIALTDGFTVSGPPAAALVFLSLSMLLLPPRAARNKTG